MEASAAGLATGDAPAADGGGEQATEQAQPDFAAVSSALDNLGSMMEEQRDLLASEPWRPEAEAETQAEQPPNPSEEFAFLNGPPEDALKGLGEFIEQRAAQKAEAAVTPLQEQLRQFQVKSETDDLMARYPDMGKPEIAKQVIDAASTFAEQLGHPELAGEPQLWEAMYLAAQARQQTQQEGAATASDATLEGAGGARPGGTQQGAQPTTQDITQTWHESSLPLFRGGARR